MVSLNRSPIRVDVYASAEERALLWARIREAWTRLGETSPHHSVISAKEFKPQTIDDEAVKRFYATGQNEMAQIDAILKRHGGVPGPVCTEYGCGLGRVTFALAKRFKHVVGLDISANHLALARQRAAHIGATNVELRQVMELELPKCDLFYSRIVFQHNPPPVMAEMISVALKSLNPGGLAIFQLPTYGAGYRFVINEYLATPNSMDMELHCLPQSEVFRIIAEADSIPLEVSEDGSIGLHGRWVSNTFVVRRAQLRPSATLASSSFDRRRGRNRNTQHNPVRTEGAD